MPVISSNGQMSSNRIRAPGIRILLVAVLVVGNRPRPADGDWRHRRRRRQRADRHRTGTIRDGVMAGILKGPTTIHGPLPEESVDCVDKRATHVLIVPTIRMERIELGQPQRIQGT